MPVFEGLLPHPFDEHLQDLLFIFSSWHGLAKLRMHTDSTLTNLDNLTMTFGTLLRRFATQTAASFATYELPKEAAAQARRRARKSTLSAAGQVAVTSTGPLPTDKKMKKLNLSTYKLHAMGDYVSTIRRYGTSDSFSTQAVSCLFHS
jgi:hypothetical protein